MRYRIQPGEEENTGQFKNGNGIIKGFNDTGKTTSEPSYKNGMLNGPCKYYYRDVLLAGECINDNRERKWIRCEKGIIRNIITYKSNLETGIACF